MSKQFARLQPPTPSLAPTCTLPFNPYLHACSLYTLSSPDPATTLPSSHTCRPLSPCPGLLLFSTHCPYPLSPPPSPGVVIMPIHLLTCPASFFRLLPVYRLSPLSPIFCSPFSADLIRFAVYFHVGFSFLFIIIFYKYYSFHFFFFILYASVVLVGPSLCSYLFFLVLYLTFSPETVNLLMSFSLPPSYLFATPLPTAR